MTDIPPPSAQSGDTAHHDHSSRPDAPRPAGLAPSAWLAELLDGSRLELAQRCRERWRERAYLVDPHHLEVRSLARLAFELASRPGSRPGDLCQLAIDLAVDDLVRLQVAREWSGAANGDEDGVEQHLVEELGVAPRRALAALRAFNACDDAARTAYFDCCLEGLSLDAHAVRRGVERDAASDSLQRALGAILGTGDAGGGDG